MGDIVEGINAELRANAATLETTTNQLNDANETIRTLREQENTRRVTDAHNAATATLNAFNANREDKIDGNVLEAVNADIDNGVYTNSVDKDGNWIGVAEVEKTVKALCADAVLAQDKAAAERSRRSYIWENHAANNAQENDGSLGSMVRNYEANK